MCEKTTMMLCGMLKFIIPLFTIFCCFLVCHKHVRVQLLPIHINFSHSIIVHLLNERARYLMQTLSFTHMPGILSAQHNPCEHHSIHTGLSQRSVLSMCDKTIALDENTDVVCCKLRCQPGVMIRSIVKCLYSCMVK